MQAEHRASRAWRVFLPEASITKEMMLRLAVWEDCQEDEQGTFVRDPAGCDSHGAGKRMGVGVGGGASTPVWGKPGGKVERDDASEEELVVRSVWFAGSYRHYPHAF